MRRADRFRYFLDYFTTNFPEPKTELVYGNPYELIVAVVLSAQCTDKRVNQVMPALLEQFPTAAHLAWLRPMIFSRSSAASPTPTTRPSTWPAWAACSARSLGAKCPARLKSCSACPAWAAKLPTWWPR